MVPPGAARPRSIRRQWPSTQAAPHSRSLHDLHGVESLERAAACEIALHDSLRISGLEVGQLRMEVAHEVHHAVGIDVGATAHSQAVLRAAVAERECTDNHTAGSV